MTRRFKVEVETLGLQYDVEGLNEREWASAVLAGMVHRWRRFPLPDIEIRLDLHPDTFKLKGTGIALDAENGDVLSPLKLYVRRS